MKSVQMARLLKGVIELAMAWHLIRFIKWASILRVIRKCARILNEVQ
jgi:hypothetical protein